MTASYRISIFAQNVASIHFPNTLKTHWVERAVEDCFDRQCHSVVIDLSEVTHAPINSIKALLSMRDAFEKANGRMVFTEVDGPVKVALELMGFYENFRFYADVNAALRDMMEDDDTTRRVSL